MNLLRPITVTLCAFSLFCSPALGEPMEKVQELYDNAIALMRKDHRANAATTLKILKEAREILFKFKELTEEQEAKLIKINAHIYWQTKFSSSANLEPITKNLTPETKTTKTIKDAEWEKVKEKKRKQFNSSLEKAQQYEKKHSNDLFSNMLNYLELQTKVVDTAQANETFDKTTYFQIALKAEREELLSELFRDYDEFKSLLNNKNYALASTKIAKLRERRNLTHKQKALLALIHKEITAMNYIKEALLENGTRVIPIPKLFQGFEGVVAGITEKGIQLSDNHGRKSTISWSILNEKALLSLARTIITGKDEDELFLLAIANMRLEDFSKAYEYFEKLIERAPLNYNRYKDFLSKCEIGHRLKTGKFIEAQLQKALELSQKGQRKAAMDILMELKDNYLNDSLGKSFNERFLLIYNEVAHY